VSCFLAAILFTFALGRLRDLATEALEMGFNVGVLILAR